MAAKPKAETVRAKAQRVLDDIIDRAVAAEDFSAAIQACKVLVELEGESSPKDNPYAGMTAEQLDAERDRILAEAWGKKK